MGRFADTVREWCSSGIVRRYAADSVWVMAARFWWVVTAFTVGILVARKLGPHDFGIVNYVVAYTGLFAIIVSLGVETLVERDLVARPAERDRILGNFCLFRVVSTLVMAAALAVSLRFMRDPKIVTGCLIVGAGYLFSPCFVVNAYFIATVNNRCGALAQIVTCTLYAGVRLTAVLASLPLEVYFWGEMLLNGGFYLANFVIYWLRCASPLGWSCRWRDSLALLKPALPLALTVIFTTIYARTDTLMLEHFRGAETVGFYSIATRFTENWTQCLYLIGQVFSSALFSAAALAPEEYRKQLHRYYFLLVWGALPAIAASLLLGRPVIRLLYGEVFLPSVPVFYVYVLTLPSNGLLFAFHRHALKENRLAAIAAAFGSGALLNVALNAALIPRWGMIGAALSSAVAMPVGLTFSLLTTPAGRRDLGFIVRSLTSLPSLQLKH